MQVELEETAKTAASISHPCNVTTSSLPSPSNSSSGKTDLNDMVGGGGEVGRLITTPPPTSPKKSQLETICCENKVNA